MGVRNKLPEIIATAIVASLSTFFITSHFQSRSKLKAESTLSTSIPSTLSANVGQLVLDLSPSGKPPTLEIDIESQGNIEASGVKMDVFTQSKSLFKSSKVLTFPRYLGYSQPEADRPDSVRYAFPSLPIQSRVSVFIDVSTSTHDSDYVIQLQDSVRLYKVSQKLINPKLQDLSFWRKALRRMFFSTNNAWAADLPSALELDHKTAGPPIYREGYDPIRMIQLVFQQYVEKGVISQTEYSDIENDARRLNYGPILGGNYLLRMNERALEVLLKKKIINEGEAEDILRKSGIVGGDVVNGYNVSYLDAELLNRLILKGKLTTDEAQMTIEKSKLGPH